MVHWYQWKEAIFCNATRLYSAKITAETLEVLARSSSITLQTSNGMILVLIAAVIVLLVLVIVGIVLAKRVASRRTRINRRL